LKPNEDDDLFGMDLLAKNILTQKQYKEA